MKNQSQHISRRTLLKRLVAMAAVGTVSSLLAACSTSSDETAESAALCEGDAGLWGSTTRKALGYVAQSPHVNKTCANCQFFKSAKDGLACGTCEIVSGPIAPEAYCNSWAAPKDSA